MVEVPKLSEEEWPEIRKVKAQRNTGWLYVMGLIRAIYNSLGEEKACEILADFMAQNANHFFPLGLKVFGIEGNDHRAAASYFKLADGDILGMNIEWIEESPRKVILRYHPPCGLFPDLNEPCATPKMCLALGNFEFTAAKLVPNVKVTFAKMLTAGDPYCDIVFEQIEER